MSSLMNNFTADRFSRGSHFLDVGTFLTSTRSELHDRAGV